MNKYELNGLGPEWVWEADSKEQATMEYIYDICGAKTIEQWGEYCKEVSINNEINWSALNE